MGKNYIDDRRPILRCTKCGYRIPLYWLPKLRKWQIGHPTEGNRISSHGIAAFIDEATKRGWSIFDTLTSDIGIDYLMGKKYAAVMIELKTATLMANNTYHVTLKKILEGPLGFVIYYFVDDKTFFILPSMKFWEIPRFKALKERVFSSGHYNYTMSLKIAREVMGDYENEKGWARLEQLTTPDGLLRAIEQFIERQKKDGK
ncbi:MAG: hypothetical protein O2V44_09475 [Candidatus Bathyarchaeota archaeon]|nr:hypothetical protein [Candidatus Bathyarchaeota archaeon]